MRKQHPSSATLRCLTQLVLGLLLILSTLITSPPAQARFLTPDTWDPMLPGVDINRYAYSGNDPVNQSDPSGHSGIGDNGGPPIDIIEELDSFDTSPQPLDREFESFQRDVQRAVDLIAGSVIIGQSNQTSRELDRLETTILNKIGDPLNAKHFDAYRRENAG